MLYVSVAAPALIGSFSGSGGNGLPPENKQRFMIDRIVATPKTGRSRTMAGSSWRDSARREHYRCHPDAKQMQADLDIKGWMEGSRARMEKRRSVMCGHPTFLNVPQFIRNRVRLTNRMLWQAKIKCGP